MEKGEHLWNSCGSEAGKDERKQTESQVHRTGEEGTGNQAGNEGENLESVSGTGAPKKPTVRREREESGKGRTEAE